MARIYRYVGEHELLDSGSAPPPRYQVDGAAAVRRWVAETGQRLSQAREVIATFVVDQAGRLWIADRHSEHVACARGAAVLAAGEITFVVDRAAVEVSEVTNQSTGYCPEPSCWDAVERTLARAALPHPGRLTTSYEFRRCDACGTRNIVKDGWLECGACQSPLSADWNFD